MGIALYFLSFCSCIGWIFILPLLMHGACRLLLEMIDGEAQVSTLWTTSSYWQTFLSMWGVFLLYGVLMLPMALLGVGLGAASDPMTAGAIQILPGLLYGFLVVRLHFAFFLVAEGRLGVLDAFARSWSATGPVWGKLILLQLLTALLSAPVQVLAIGVQVLAQPAGQAPPDPNQALELLGLYGALMVVSIIVGTLNWSFYAAAYRQLLGRAG